MLQHRLSPLIIARQSRIRQALKTAILREFGRFRAGFFSRGGRGRHERRKRAENIQWIFRAALDLAARMC
jgi:hypothetical protein